MDEHRNVALVQTLPIVVNARTLFARWQQFAGRLYGPLIAAGIAWWHGSEGNYWGHNAIIRVRAFARDAALPELKGRKPFGGHILSHDFIEAAFMRRGGWAIHMTATLGGSYEESPPSLLDFAARDRRWCQGNLQHLALLPARGLHWVSRLHLLTGIGSYLTAPLWFIFLVFGILVSLQAQFVRPEYFPKGFSLFPTWPAQDPILAAWVFVATMGMLILPKMLAYIVMLTHKDQRKKFGGGFRAFAGILAETFLSGLTAPVMMIFQSSAVAGILLGHDAGWQVQRRDDGAVSYEDTLRKYSVPTLFGIAMAISAYAVSVALLLWMMPVILGLLLAVPLAMLFGGVQSGLRGGVHGAPCDPLGASARNSISVRLSGPSLQLQGEGGACRRQAVPIARRSNTSLNSKGRTTSAQAHSPDRSLHLRYAHVRKAADCSAAFRLLSAFRAKRYQRGPTPKPTPTPPGPTPMPTLGPLS
jgi:membrane glycosyltransferase